MNHEPHGHAVHDPGPNSVPVSAGKFRLFGVGRIGPDSALASEIKRAAEIEFDFPDALPLVFVDQIQIQQVLINLISNGIEATENTGRSPKIRIAAKAEKDDTVVIDVADNGSGIAGIDRIFDPFFTTKAKGMGIGLAVSRSIVESHDGWLMGSNNVDVGATFSIGLPAVCAASEPCLPV